MTSVISHIVLIPQAVALLLLVLVVTFAQSSTPTPMPLSLVVVFINLSPISSKSKTLLVMSSKNGKIPPVSVSSMPRLPTWSPIFLATPTLVISSLALSLALLVSLFLVSGLPPKLVPPPPQTLQSPKILSWPLIHPLSPLLSGTAIMMVPASGIARTPSSVQLLTTIWAQFIPKFMLPRVNGNLVINQLNPLGCKPSP
ncbi:hypothetical protein G3KMM_00098 [Candidatus Nanosyncoccus nanoralicus]|uniref:Uncharacterized protein n=1 Tax=Candidatus Nanosyncoccus nanoralicus TaxID=2171996 RepID=A0ABY0FKX7_9BACT|nr:hypothetical protein G3KMM_00098 [Candidatus Nanosyncoccus nanoralicus]